MIMSRTFPGILLAIAWVVLLLAGTPLYFQLVMLIVTAIGINEYLDMALESPPSISTRVLSIATLLLPYLGGWYFADTAGIQFGLFAATFFIFLYTIGCYSRLNEPYRFLSRLILGVVYVGVLVSYLPLIRNLPEGGEWLVVLTAITAGSDSGAYYSGRQFGKHKLSPAISPKKTIEGAVGGLVCAILAGIVLAVLLFDKVNLPFILFAAIILTGVGILGDLAESIIKRGTGTKDSGRLLAGHGGILDRIDSILLAAPVLYYLLYFFMGIQ